MKGTLLTFTIHWYSAFSSLQRSMEVFPSNCRTQKGLECTFTSVASRWSKLVSNLVFYIGWTSFWFVQRSPCFCIFGATITLCWLVVPPSFTWHSDRKSTDTVFRQGPMYIYIHLCKNRHIIKSTSFSGYESIPYLPGITGSKFQPGICIHFSSEIHLSRSLFV